MDDSLPSESEAMAQTQVASATTGPRSEARSEVPARLGRYIVIDLLGEGGMGRVYSAFDPDLDRKVAVKVIRRDRGEGGQGRLLREAQAMARLAHENVVPVHDVGTVGDQVFVAMEFVEGTTLRDWARARPPWREVVDVYVQAGRGLAAAHEVGLVHRDFKPDNALVRTRPGGGLRVQVLDFGLAKGVADTDDKEPAAELATLAGDAASGEGAGMGTTPATEDLTRTGSLLGTPRYMAPEQHRGTEVDARSDQFAFCVSLYEALYGQLPFAGNTATSIGFNVVRGKLRPPPEESPVPAWVHRIIERGLSTESSARWPDMRSLLSALGEDPGARRKAWGTRIAVGGVVAVLGALAVFRPASESPSEAPPACVDLQAPFAEVWDEAARARVVEAFEASKLSFAPDAASAAAARIDAWGDGWHGARVEACEATRVRGEQSAELMDLRMACLDRSLRETAAVVDALAEADEKLVRNVGKALEELPEFGGCADVEALRSVEAEPEDPEAQAAIAKVREGVAQTKKLAAMRRNKEAAEALGELAVEAEATGYAPVHAETLFKLGRARAQAGDEEQAVADLEQALWRAIESRHSKIEFDALEELVYVTGFLQAQKEQGERWGSMLAATLEGYEASEGRRAAYWSSMGMLHYKSGEQDKARTAIEKAIELRERAGKRPATNDHNVLGTILLAIGDYAGAKHHISKSLALSEERYGKNHPQTAFPMNNLGLVHERLTEYDEAVATLERSRELIAASQGEDHPNVGLIDMNIGGILVLADRVDEAGAYHDRALPTLKAALGEDHQLVGRAYTLRAQWDMARGDAKAAEASARAGIATREEALGPDHPDLALTRVELGRALVAQGELDEGTKALEAALASMLGDAGDRDPVDVGLNHAYVSDAMRKSGDEAGAREHRESAFEWFAKGGPTGEREAKRFRARSPD